MLLQPRSHIRILECSNMNLPSGLNNFSPVSKYVANTGGRKHRVLIRSRAVDGVWIEYNHIGEIALSEAAALCDSEAVSRLVGDFVNSLRKRKPAAFTAHFTQ